MDAAMAYCAIADRLRYFIGLQSEDFMYPDPEEQKVCLEFQMPGGDCLKGHFRCSALGNPVLESTWCDDMIQHAKMEVFWSSAKSCSTNPTVKFCWTPPEYAKCLYPVLHSPGVFLLWHDGGALLSAQTLQVGDYKMLCDHHPARVKSVERGAEVEWVFELKDRLPHDRTTFNERFGSCTVQLTLELKPSAASRILIRDIAEILSRHGDVSTELSVRDKKIVQVYRRELIARPADAGYFILKSEGYPDEIRVNKSTLAARSPVFAACFRHPESEEVKQNCCIVPSSTPEAVINFVVFCDIFLIPDMEEHYLELTKLAHKYQILTLLDLCELYMMGEVSAIMRYSYADTAKENFSEFLDICQVATLLELPLLLVQLHYVVADLERTIVHMPGMLPDWRKFLAENPDFGAKRYAMIEKISIETIKKRKLEEDDEETQ